MDQECSPFLPNDDIDDKTNQPTFRDSRDQRARVLRISAVANCLLLLICVVESIALWSLLSSSSRGTGNPKCNQGPPEPYSPASAVIEFEQRPMTFNDTQFTGYPDPIWEKSMQELLAGTLFRISEAELKRHGSNAIPLKGGGFAAGLGISHHLHCVKKIKQLLYREYFYPEISLNSEEYMLLQRHADHCLDFLRQDVMCRIDYSLYTLYWGNESQASQGLLLHHYPNDQRCINWEKVHAWMRTREVSSDMLTGP